MNVLTMIADMSPTDRSRILWALSIMMLMVIVGFTAILLFRRRLRSQQADTSADVGFSLSDLRKMRDNGEITSEEYEATRAKVIAKVKQSFEPKPPKGKGLPGMGGTLPGELGGEAGTDFTDPTPPLA